MTVPAHRWMWTAHDVVEPPQAALFEAVAEGADRRLAAAAGRDRLFQQPAVPGRRRRAHGVEAARQGQRRPQASAGAAQHGAGTDLRCGTPSGRPRAVAAWIIALRRRLNAAGKGLIPARATRPAGPRPAPRRTAARRSARHSRNPCAAGWRAIHRSAGEACRGIGSAAPAATDRRRNSRRQRYLRSSRLMPSSSHWSFEKPSRRTITIAPRWLLRSSGQYSLQRHAGQRDHPGAFGHDVERRAASRSGRRRPRARLIVFAAVRVAKNSNPSTASTCAVVRSGAPRKRIASSADRHQIRHQPHVGIGRAEHDPRKDHERDGKHDRGESEVARQRQLAAEDREQRTPARRRSASRCRTISTGRAAPNRSSATSSSIRTSRRSARRGSRCARRA